MVRALPIDFQQNNGVTVQDAVGGRLVSFYAVSKKFLRKK